VKKKILLIPLALLLAISVVATGCPQPPVEVPGEIPAPPKVFNMRLQHSWGAAENHFFEQYADIVREMSGGRIDIAVFSDGEIVTMEELPDAVAMGMIDMGHTHPGYHLGKVPMGLLESAPFFWENLDQVLAVLYEFGIGDLYREAMEEVFGFHVLGFQPNDFGAMMTKERITSLADLKGATVNIFDPMASIMAELYGTTATYLGPEELYTALALGIIEAVEYGGVKAMTDMGLHEVTRTLVMPYHVIAYTPFYFINRDLWEELPADLQAILREAVYANAIYMRSFYAGAEIAAIEKAKAAGVTVFHMPEEEMEAMFQLAVKWLEEEFALMDRHTAQAADIVLEALRKFGRID